MTASMNMNVDVHHMYVSNVIVDICSYMCPLKLLSY